MNRGKLHLSKHTEPQPANPAVCVLSLLPTASSRSHPPHKHRAATSSCGETATLHTQGISFLLRAYLAQQWPRGTAQNATHLLEASGRQLCCFLISWRRLKLRFGGLCQVCWTPCCVLTVTVTQLPGTAYPGRVSGKWAGPSPQGGASHLWAVEPHLRCPAPEQL